MRERFEIYIVYKKRYINTLPFLSFPFLYLQLRHAVKNEDLLDGKFFDGAVDNLGDLVLEPVQLHGKYALQRE